MFQKRINQLKMQMNSHGLDSLAFNAGPDLVYFSGLHFHISERPVILIITLSEKPVLIFPEFEQEKVNNSPVSVVSFPYGEDRSEWGKVFSSAGKSIHLDHKKIGLNPVAMRFLETELISKMGLDCSLVSAAELLAFLRTKKDAGETAAITKAVEIAQQALDNTLPFISTGKTEKEIANELAIQLLKAGSDPELPFMPIVAAGMNSANPHAVPSEKRITGGELLLIDWGARYDGYVSDLTRTFSIGPIQPLFEEIGKTVLKANEDARRTSGEKVTSHQIDQAARAVIEKAGYGEFFTHRTGHGIGLEPHEEPYIQSGNQITLEEGMTFTIEPGIYLPGKGGVRIEDNVIVEKGQLRTITTYPREIREL
jgi:Xaa-Pro dipeptidase